MIRHITEEDDEEAWWRTDFFFDESIKESQKR